MRNERRRTWLGLAAFTIGAWALIAWAVWALLAWLEGLHQ